MAVRAAIKSKRDTADAEVKLWRERIESYHTDFEKWEKRCEKIIKRYRDERKTGEGAGSQDDKTRRYNALWANVQTLRPALYGQQPVPVVERRFLDRDPVARAASIIWERAIRYEIDDNGLHRTMKKTVLDYLLCGRGVPWVRYEPEFGEAVSPSPSAEDDGEDTKEKSETAVEEAPPAPKLVTETAWLDYVHWRDFVHGQARTWEENDFVGRRLYLDESEIKLRFGKKIAKAIPMTFMPEGPREGARHNASEDKQKAKVYEIWSKRDKKVYFIADGYDRLLEDPREDPLKLEGFWPCPEPLYATLTNDTLVPVPDYVEYQDQAQELDDLTNRIATLQKALKVCGIYDASNTSLQRLLQEGSDNELIPHKNWSSLTEKGGLNGAVSLLDVKPIAEALLALYEAREKVKQDLGEISGIADIVRGEGDPQETATAQDIKSNFGSLRLVDRKEEIARFARDTIRIIAEVIANHFSDETLIRASGALYDEALMKPNPLLAMLVPSPGSPQGQGAPQSPGVAQAGQAAGAPMAAPPPGAPPMQGGMPPQGMPPPGMPPQGIPPPPPPINPETQQPYTPEEIDKLPRMVPDQELIAKALALVRDEKMRGFRIEIEVDSTVQPNPEKDKQARTEFMTGVTTFLETSSMIAAGNPDAVPMLGKMLQFAVRGFRVGRDLESTIDEFVDKAEKQAKAKAGQPPPPNPDLIKAQAQAQKSQADIQIGQAKLALDQQKAQADNAAEQQKAQAEIAKSQIDAQNEASNRQAEMQMKTVDYQMKQMEMRIKEMELHSKEQELGHKASLAEYDRRFKELDFAGKHEEIGHKQHMAQQDMGHKERMAQHEFDTKAREHDMREKETSVAEKSTGDTAKHLQKMHEQVLEVVKRASAPRRIERDKTGRAVRVISE